jgi:NAD(P)H-dependent flavin oxidoreductase YrpB (nitropropane dioxygenase family)
MKGKSVLVPAVVDAVDLPVIAAGGIGGGGFEASWIEGDLSAGAGA